MTPQEFFKSKTKEQLLEIAKKSHTTYSNLQQICMYGGSVSTRLAIQIAEATRGELSAVQLKPDLARLEISSIQTVSS